MNVIDAFVAACLVPLAIAAVVSGLDDLVLDLWFAVNRFRRRPESGSVERGEQHIAVFVPLWHEHAVIGRMLRHNLETVRYTNYDFFIGVYPNDPQTMDEVREIEASTQRVHMAVVPHDGPTSKADCLNWIYQGMLAHEEACGQRFDVIVTHDAEDIIHPESLRLIDCHSRSYDMVQVPVLPLVTPAHRLTHGIYCDEFAEYQTKDVPARLSLGGFLPSNGVGTGYTRRALEALAASASNCVFNPACLTEDYDCGIRLHRLGFRQLFVPIDFEDGEPVATREFFPQRFWQAVRQRTRWVIGIALQGWELHGWRGGPGSVYWFWRDRKGLLGNPLSLAGNLICVYGLATWTACHLWGRPWGLGRVTFTPVEQLWLAGALVSQAFRLLVRACSTARIYGWTHAAAVPIRSIVGNWMNAIATVLAIQRYIRARLARQSHVWLKTEHVYPEIEEPAILPQLEVNPRHVPLLTARALPEHVVKRWRVLPFRISEGNILIATPQEPSRRLKRELSRFTRLQIKFCLVSVENFEKLKQHSGLSVQPSAPLTNSRKPES